MNLFLPMLGIGLVTSVHCVTMCGPLVLTYAVKGDQSGPLSSRMLPHAVYHGAKVVSYTIIGLIVGAIGAAFNIGGIRGWVMVVAGAFMITLGLSMTGWFPALRKLTPRPPKFLVDLLRRTRKHAAEEAAEGKSSLATPVTFGLLTGLLPCGPLYAAMTAAAGAGSAINGGMAMFAFGLGTVPLLLGFGAVSGYLGAKLKDRMMVGAAVLVMLVGLVMLNRGAMMVGSPVTFDSVRLAVLGGPPAGARPVSFRTAADGVAEIPLVIRNTQFVPSTVTIPSGRAVRLIVDRRESNACSDQLAIPSLGVLVNLKANGVTKVDLPASSAGNHTLTCGMGMMGGMIRASSASASEGETPRSAVSYVLAAGAAVTVIGGGVLLARRRDTSDGAASDAAQSKTPTTHTEDSDSSVEAMAVD